PQDDFKWFGEGFSSFPKKLPEDVVEYLIFVIDTKLSDTQTRERLQAFQRALTNLEKKFLKEYIWQRESINLSLIRENNKWLLRGSTNYGDSVADEWLIVWLLRELSKEFKDAWIRIYDTDGEFLLIEAANALPRWLNPEVAEHRVWINKHRLHIIPLSPKEEPKPLQLPAALSTITSTPAKLRTEPKLENEAFHRLTSYPSAISENQHHATLPLPRKLAHILHTNPSYIALAVEAFYLRDPISLRFLQPSKSKTTLVFPPEDFVTVSIRFTKVLFAQLRGQNWDSTPPYSTALEHLLAQPEWSSTPDKPSLAIKLAAGFEMLVQHSLYADKVATREIKLLLDDLDAGDDALPTDAEIAAWPKQSDDEKWLDIDFSAFEQELSGTAKKEGAKSGFGDKSAQENLRKMVERFTAFVEDEDAGLEGAKGLKLDPMDVDNDSDPGRGWDDPEGNDNEGDSDDDVDSEYADEEYAEYERAFEKFMTLSVAEKTLLTDEARELALKEEAEKDEDEEIKKLSDLMEKELFSHGALDLNPEKQVKRALGKTVESSAKGKGKAKANADVADESEEEDFEYLDEDYNLADNMLKSFKGQVGMPGPAGNLMGLMGIQFPPDAESDDE
ncbi:SGT1-domain-containing protein, partial [Sporormia fimetaria CBS 119925]